MRSGILPKSTFFNLNEEKQEKIMRAAISEFLSQGFEKGNIGVIAKNASVAKGSMYQYFENKKELFLYCVQWAIGFTMKKYQKYISYDQEKLNIFDYLYEGSKELWGQLKDEREVIIFIQDVFLGKYSNLTDQSMGYMMKVMDEQMKIFIVKGKEQGYIRKDIDDEILSLFLTGASIKIKEHMMNKARKAGEDIIDEDFDKHDKEIRDILELIKNGMGAK